MPHEGPSHSTLETRNPERALYDSYKEVAGQASLEPSQLLALNESERSTSKPQPPVQTHNAELPANEECSAKKKTRHLRDSSPRKNRIAVACLAVALAGIIITAAIIGIKTSQHGSPQSSTMPVAPSPTSTRRFSSREQTTSRLETTAIARTETSSVKLNISSALSSATIHPFQSSSTLISSPLVSILEPLPTFEHSTLLSTTPNMSEDTRSRAAADSPHAATSVRPVFSSFDQTNNAQHATTYSKLSGAAFAAQTPSNIDQITVTTSLAPSANLPQPTTSIKSSRPKITATLNAQTITALDQLTPTNCLQSSDIWKGPLTVDSPDTCDGT
ncbi:MAG: hypothetical protein HETSPECPRED_009297 [Heterodermia speciosa]|uniref:Uncharacterized protein n=1 Tax=Heterodermia speciosa TaxID=116794 RepID=A0A8H3G800_9LECA|nr:MAG: hypothetical protein HETSPECPRED_009297 [Heterodermia speciosa]